MGCAMCTHIMVEHRVSSPRRSGLVALGIVAAALCASACSGPIEDEVSPPSSSSDSLTERDWGRAVRYLRDIGYLPWGYTNDGCYARALYYTMNLAAEGIAANHVYIVAKPGYGLGSNGTWSYHVAPLVSRDSTGELLVLDPIWAPSNPQPIPLTQWYAMQTKWEGTANAPALRVASGNTYGQTGSGAEVPDPARPDTARFREPKTFAEMPAFSISTVNSACGIMHTYIDAENLATKAKKHHDLSRDTRRLVTALADLGKLSGKPSELSAECTKFAPEIAACPADSRQTNPGSTECCLASAFWCASGGACNAPGTKLADGAVCGAGGNFSHPVGPAPAAGGNGSTSACPADSPSTSPGSYDCCVRSMHWCWSASGGFCAAPGTRRTVSDVTWTCGPGGEWSR